MTRVAIIEDDETMRQMLVKMIDSAAEYRCVCACSTVQEALTEVPKHMPDVALMDIHLPDGSGIACTATLVQKIPGLQVIIVTVYNDTEVIFKALKAGASGYILKRFRPEEIMAAIAQVRAGGAPMTAEIARMVVRSFWTPPAAPPAGPLTARETEILELLARGFSNKEIGHQLGITAGTVGIHAGHIFEKLHVRCRTEAAAEFFRTQQGGANGDSNHQASANPRAGL